MTSSEARDILLLYRPGTADAADPKMAEALALARQDPELGRWFEQHRAFQKSMRAGFRQIEVPAHLKASLLIQNSGRRTIITPQVWWRSPIWLTAVATVVLALGLAVFWPNSRSLDRFANFQSRMVGAAQLAYRMDIETNDMQQVRQFMASSGAPADYDLARGLEHLQLTGGGRLTWRSNPVAMVCFDRGDKQMLFLFVMKRSAVKDAPPKTPRLAKVRDMLTASWTQGDKTYLLAGPDDSALLRKQL